MKTRKFTAERFKAQAESRSLTFWPIHECSICGVWVGFVFKNGQSCYDSACSCVPFATNYHSYGWQFVADMYNMQTDPEIIARFDKYWGFNNDDDDIT